VLFLAADKDIIDYLNTTYVHKCLQGFTNDSNYWSIKVTIIKFKDKLWENVDALQKWFKRKRGLILVILNTCVTPVYLEGSIPEAMIMVNDKRKL
jgi:glycine C-acetyltransferase